MLLRRNAAHTALDFGHDETIQPFRVRYAATSRQARRQEVDTGSDLGLLRDLQGIIDLDPQGIAPCFRALYAQEATGQLGAFSSADRSTSLSFGASNVCHTRSRPTRSTPPNSSRSARIDGSTSVASRSLGWETNTHSQPVGAGPSRRALTAGFVQ